MTVNVYSDARTLGELPTLEYDYEAPTAILVSRRGQSFKVRLPSGTGWIRASRRNEFRSRQQLLDDGLIHVTESGGELRGAPGETGVILRERARENQAVRLGHRALIHDLEAETVAIKRKRSGDIPD